MQKINTTAELFAALEEHGQLYIRTLDYGYIGLEAGTGKSLYSISTDAKAGATRFRSADGRGIWSAMTSGDDTVIMYPYQPAL